MTNAILIFFIKVYQSLLSPLLGNHCRFYPSCSAYGIQSIRKQGAVKGSLKTAQRILRCHPWNPGGVDMP